MSLEHAFFYKSVNGDRVYDDASFEHWLKKFFTSGVFLNDLQVTTNDDMTVTVGAGYVNADGKVKIFESATPLIIETAGASYPRIDSIVLERNDTERDILLKVVKGGYSSEPVAHTPVRQDGVYQLVIAQILVNAGAVKVTQANITDTRSNTELCGIVAATVDQIDFSQIQAQFDSYFAQYKKQIATDYTQYNEDMETYLNQMAEDFATWFEGIRNQLDEDAAGHLQNQIDDINARLEYAGGSIVEVTVNDNEGAYNVEGLEVNLVIDGKTYTETIKDNVVKFTGVLEVGTATITCVGAVQEFNAETSIEIPYYGAYETSIKCGASYKEWIEAGGLNPSSYETLDDLLEDETAIRTLMTKKAAVDVLAKMSGDDLATIINHPYIAKWVNYREYAYSTLSAVSEIKTIMDASGMYGMYITVESDGTWQPKGLVPVMTSNNAPYGEASASGYYNANNYPAWKVFDGKTPTSNDCRWVSNDTSNQWLCYKAPNPTNVVAVYLLNEIGNNNQGVKTFRIEYSDNGTEWLSASDVMEAVEGENELFYTNDCGYHLYWRLYAYTSFGGKISVGELQFYGRQLEALIPPMTSNTTPMGEASASSAYSADNAAWCAFVGDSNKYWHSDENNTGEYVQYTFNKPVKINAITCMFGTRSSDSKTTKFKAQYSLDGTDWYDIENSETEYTGTFSNGKIYATCDLNNVAAIRIVNTYTPTNLVAVTSVQVYGTPDYESRTYIYEHGVELGCESMINANGWTHSSGNVYTEPTYYDDYVQMQRGSTNGISAIAFKDTVDLSKYNVVGAIVEGVTASSSSNCGMIAIYPSKTSLTPTANRSIPIPHNPKIYLDISSINNSLYVALAADTGKAIKGYALWLE